MTQDEFILKSFDVLKQYNISRRYTIKKLSKVIGIPQAEINRVISENDSYKEILNEKPMDATEEELLNFPAYTWENLSEAEKQWYNENNTISDQGVHLSN